MSAPGNTTKAAIWATIAVGALVIAVSWRPSVSVAVSLSPGDEQVRSRGEALYQAHCASCHGTRLEGQPDWQSRDTDGYLPAPPHDATGHTWHHADDVLFDLTKRGVAGLVGPGYKTRMPAYQERLTDEEIVAVLSFIKSRWPEQIRRRHDRLNAASQRSKQRLQ